MTVCEDVPLTAPSLLDSVAAVISHHIEDQKLPTFLNETFLPMPASHAVFNQYKHKWRKGKFGGLLAFTDSGRAPLGYLDLSGLTIDDSVLVKLLRSHKDSITMLDLTDTKNLTSTTNILLYKERVTLKNLRRLKCTSMDLLLRPPPRRKNGVAALDRSIRGIPALNEDDLERSISIHNRMNMPDGRLGLGGSIFDPTTEQPAVEGFECNMAGSGFGSHQCECCSGPSEEREPPVFTSICPHVTHLSIPLTRRLPDDQEQSVNEVLTRIVTPLTKLTHLDISYWTRVDDLRCLYPLSLTSLILYDVPDVYKAIDTVVMLTELRSLDLSQSSKDTGTYPKPVTTLHNLVRKLTHLENLDISGTNLASQPSFNDWPLTNSEQGSTSVRSDIVGLRGLHQKLRFLGLFNCENASHFGEIPANRIAGDANEDQVIMALGVYKERAGLLQSVLNESYQLYRFGNTTPLVRHTEALHLVLGAMQKHLDDSTLQIAGSASLFYIIRKVGMNRDTKKQVVSALLSGMETHMEEQVMVRNCCLSLCQFEIPQEILFDYSCQIAHWPPDPFGYMVVRYARVASRLAVLLVKVLEHHNADNLTQRIVVFLLNSMACHVEGEQKVQVGNFGAIEMILEQIKRKHTSNVCDDVMEVGWSFLWNITDETPPNCERFLRAQGLELFKKCFDSFRLERELVRNMMGLIGNIAEVDHLRHQLMRDDYVIIFCALLEHVEDSIEISYNSAGVLAHMVSDGEDAWQGLVTKREDVMNFIVLATKRWQLDTRRFINYRSFRPILRLLPLWNAHASQHWAVWALANLTTTDGDKYCSYVREEGGVPLLEALVSDARTTEDIRKLAQTVLDNIDTYKVKTENADNAEVDVEMDTS